MQLQIFLKVFVLLLLSFGIISLTAIMQGWFGYMTASGNEDKADQAKNKIISGAICLAVIMALYAFSHDLIEKTETVMAESNENFDKIFTTTLE